MLTGDESTGTRAMNRCFSHSYTTPPVTWQGFKTHGTRACVDRQPGGQVASGVGEADIPKSRPLPTRRSKVTETIEERTAATLGANTGLRFCDGCLALRVGASRQMMQSIVATFDGLPSVEITTGRWSVCRHNKTVIRVVADRRRRPQRRPAGRLRASESNPSRHDGG
jgi:hypothetical protein